jgi:hypothetical protein
MDPKLRPVETHIDRPSLANYLKSQGLVSIRGEKRAEFEEWATRGGEEHGACHSAQ